MTAKPSRLCSALQASYGFGLVHHLAMPQQQAMANPIGPLVPEPGQAWGSSPLEMATLDLGPIQNADKVRVLGREHHAQSIWHPVFKIMQPFDRCL